MIFEVLYSRYHGYDWKDCDTIKAYDHEEAAEKWAEREDQLGNYSIIGCGESEDILVREEGETYVRKFKVFAESCPRYRARELK